MLPGKRDQERKILHIPAVEIESAVVVGGQELVDTYAERAPRPPVYERSALFVVELHNVRLGVGHGSLLMRLYRRAGTLPVST